MYFPIFRGRQFELLALRECIDRGLLGGKIVPIIEPVKASSTYVSTIDAFIEKERKIVVIRNPEVGNWKDEYPNHINERLKERIEEQLKSDFVIPALYVDESYESMVQDVLQEKHDFSSLILLCNSIDYIDKYRDAVNGNAARYSLIPDKRIFKRIKTSNRVLCEDHFPKRLRNSDYGNNTDEFFSDDYLYYKEEGYIGFSDYSVVGSEYSESGFAPYAVAIHIVYPDNGILKIKHFVSDSNEDYHDTVRKFREAVEKLVKWNEARRLETWGIKQFEAAYHDGTYPGLGVVKKYSIMHHLELMNGLLEIDEE